MSDIFYDLETKELLDTSNPDQDAAIRVLRLSVGATWCACHDAQFFRTTAPLTEHLLAHTRIVGFNILRFDNTVLAWSPERPVHEKIDPVSGKRIIEKPLPDAPEDLKKLLDSRSFDLQADLENRLGHRVSLAALAEATLGKEKSATAAQAVVWNRFAAILRDKWSLALLDVGDQEGAQRVNELGRWFQERLEEYCLQDALLVKKLFEYAIANKRVAFIDFEGERRAVKVQWK
ncbi:MAG: hypothetical protein HY868_22065 [Chloroflexi bacterium]|nr:hypothetical protein [Chloroflexota bacterium]